MAETYRIAPKQPKVLTAADVRRDGNYGCLGAVTWVCVCIGAFVVLADTGLPARTHWLLWLSPFAAASAAVAALLEFKRDQKAARDVVVKNKELARQVIEEAERATESALRLHRDANRCLEALRSDVAGLTNCVNRAQAEFAANAFAPFWDNVEWAFTWIPSFKQHLEELERGATAYNGILTGREHSCPPYPVSINDIPDLRAAVRSLGSVIRRGQTNFQFASIWEHRRTREVLIEGFKTLGDAVHNIDASVARSLADFERRMSSVLRERR